MKMQLAAVKVTVIAALVLALVASSASATSEPIPGIDVIVKRNPGGIVVGKTQTGKNGEFVIEKLEAGTYDLEIQAPKTGPKASINISRSNIKKPGVTVKNDVETHKLEVEFGTEKATKPHAPVPFTISTKSGTISGVITVEETPKKDGPK